MEAICGEGASRSTRRQKQVEARRAHELVDDGRVLQQLVDLPLHSGVTHHRLHVVGIVGVDTHFGERIEPSFGDERRRSARSCREGRDQGDLSRSGSVAVRPIGLPALPRAREGLTESSGVLRIHEGRKRVSEDLLTSAERIGDTSSGRGTGDARRTSRTSSLDL